MPTPAPSWNTHRVLGTWNRQDGTMRAGTYKATVPVRVTNQTDRVIIPSGVFAEGALNTTPGVPSLDLLLPATNDTDNLPQGWQMVLEVTFLDAAGERYDLDLPVGGETDLVDVILTQTLPIPREMLVRGVPGGIAELDADGDVVDAAGDKVGAGLDEAALGSYLTTNQYATDADVTAATSGLVPSTRTVAGKALSGNVTLTAADVSAVPTTRTVAGKALSANVTLVPGDVGATTAGTNLVTAADVTTQRGILQLPDLNVKTFGALGNDGAADDTAAIQAAIDAASFGQNVTFPRGIYRITAPLQMKLGTSLVGVAAARFAHYQTTTGANTSAPAIGSVIRVGGTFSGAAAVMATAATAPGYTTGAVRIRDIVIDGRGKTDAVVDGFRATGVLYDARLERVTVLGMSGVGVSFVADGSGDRPLAAQLISVMVRGCAGHGFDLLFADSYLADCYALSNGVTGSAGSGFVLRRLANTTIQGCRSEWNGQHGFHFTGLSGGGGVVTGCVTDRNNWNGVFCDGTGDNGNLLFTGLAMRRDGRNGAAGGGGYAGFRASGTTQAIILTGFTVTPGVDDDGTTGTLSPEVGIRASGSRSLSFSDGIAHAATTPILDSGSNTSLLRGMNVTTATGTITSPTYTHTQAPSITKAMVSLGNVDNTSDANKPVSTATATALAGKTATVAIGTATTSQRIVIVPTAGEYTGGQAGDIVLVLSV